MNLSDDRSFFGKNYNDETILRGGQNEHDISLCDKIDLGNLLSNLILERVTISPTKRIELRNLYTDLLIFCACEFEKQFANDIEILIKLENVNSIFKDVVMVIIKELKENQGKNENERTFEVSLKEKFFELHEKNYIQNVSLHISTLINALFKAVYDVEIEFHLSRKYNTIRVLFKEIKFKYYERIKFIDKFVINKHVFMQEIDYLYGKKNVLVYSDNLNNILEIKTETLEWLQIEYPDQSVEKIKNIYNFIIYDKVNPNTTELKVTHGYVFLHSMKNGNEYQCTTCKNEKKVPIHRVYFSEKNHKFCKINFCGSCYEHYTNITDIYYPCFICKKFKINFSKITIIKGGKPKRDWGDDEQIVLFEA